MDFVDFWKNLNKPPFPPRYPFADPQIPVHHRPAPPHPSSGRIPVNYFRRSTEPRKPNAVPNPSPPPGVREVPVTNRRTGEPHKPKAVQIPVRFVVSDKTSSESAARIQNAWRRFRVRKSVRKILEIRREVDEAEKKILEEASVEIFRRDERERLRMNETLMRLLLRLDSVRGVDDAVRVCRKSVTRRVILLQEKFDSIVAGGGSVDESDSQEDAQGVAEVEDCGRSLEAAEEGDETAADNADVIEETLRLVRPAADEERDASVHAIEGDKLQDDLMMEESSHDDGNVNSEVPTVKAAAADGDDGDSVLSLANSESWVEGGEEEERDGDDVGKGEEDDAEILQPMSIEEKQLDGKENIVDAIDSKDKNHRELLEKMTGDHEKMMGMMTELFENNKKQTQILTSLTKRVDQLERAFICDLLRRKKKKKNVAT
ncbi:hypothetical protein Dimus_015332 [Dionaea muscipula]